MSTAALSDAAVTVRRAKIEDATACGQICYEAFHKINTDHNFPPDVPAPEGGIGLITRMFSDPGFYCVVAEADGRILLNSAGVKPIAALTPLPGKRRLGQAFLSRSEATKEEC